jgi:hypothetical protein
MYGKPASATGKRGPISLRSCVMNVWAWTYLPSYSVSASIARQSAPAATAAAPTCA